jgi:hypothetical protein
MGMAVVSGSTGPYLDYLDKEMTIQGILSAFCVAVGAAAFDRILGVKKADASGLVANLQYFSAPFVLAAIIALITAALFFYLQRSKLAWLHGQISLAVARDMQGIPTPSDANSLEAGLSIGNSWALWNCYKFGMSFLVVTAAEAACALYAAILSWQISWLITIVPFLIAAVVDLILLYVMNRRDNPLPETTDLKRRG